MPDATSTFSEEGQRRKILAAPVTQSGIPVKVVYGPEDVPALDYERDLGDPGRFPFTRGTYPEQYRRRLWVSGVLGEGALYNGQKPIKQLIEDGLLDSGLRKGADYHVLACVDPDHPLVKYDLARGCPPLFALWNFGDAARRPNRRRAWSAAPRSAGTSRQISTSWRCTSVHSRRRVYDRKVSRQKRRSGPRAG